MRSQRLVTIDSWRYINILYVCMCVCVCVCMHVYRVGMGRTNLFHCAQDEG